jgi:exopolysaccharide production protein ExoQ
MKILRNLEKIYVVISMLFLASGVIQRTIAEGDVATQLQQGPGDKYGQIIVYSFLILLLAVHRRKILNGLMHSGWIVALCGLAMVSTAWSFNWQFTAQRSILVLAMTLFGVYLATCFDWDEQLNLFGWLSVVAVAGSVFMAIFVPEYGLSHDIHAGTVKGLFPHKNMLGRQMAFAVLTLWLARPKSLPNWLRKATLVGACILLVLSSAVTAILSFATCLALYPVVHIFQIRRKRTLPLWVPLAPVLAMGVVAVFANYGAILEATGKSATLTGRTVIWHAVNSAIAVHPLLGYGQDVFWDRWSNNLAKAVFVLGFRPPHAHNGYLDILLSLGVAGLFIFLGGYLTSLWRAEKVFASNEIHGAKWPLFTLIFFAAFNFGESSILRQLTFLWIPYVSIYVSMALMSAEQRQTVFSETSADQSGGDYEEVSSGGGVNNILPGYGT